jgi:hypothetical protein
VRDGVVAVRERRAWQRRHHLVAVNTPLTCLSSRRRNAALAKKTPTAGLVSKSSFAIGSFCNRFERESLQWAPEPTGMLPCGQLRPPCQRQLRLHHHRHHQLLRSLPEVQPLRHRLLRKPSTVTE